MKILMFLIIIATLVSCAHTRKNLAGQSEGSDFTRHPISYEIGGLQR